MFAYLLFRKEVAGCFMVETEVISDSCVSFS